MKNKILRNITLILIAVVFVWFSFIIFANGYRLGNFAGQIICLYAGFLTLFYNKLKEKGFKILMNVLLGIFIVGMAWIAFLTVRIFGATLNQNAPSDCTVIVLGAKVNENTGPSLSFRQRLDVAYEFLKENPNSNCIVTGGQGANEPCTEGSSGVKYLIEKGVDSSRLFAEENSTSTWENLQFSKKIIEEENLNPIIAVSTQNFHLFRATSQAKDQDYKCYSIVASTYTPLLPGYYGRELLALSYYYFSKLF